MARILATIACILAASALLGTTYARGVDSAPTSLLDEPEEGGEPAPTSETFTVDGSVVFAGSVPIPDGSAMAAVGQSGAMDIDVPPGVTAILAELQYTGLGPGFVLYVGDPSDAWSEVHPADATAPSLQQFRVDTPLSGTWSVLGFAETVAVNAQFTLAFTVFYGEVPDGFSAFA